MRRTAVLLALIAAPATAQDWCGAPDLNRTEATICHDAILGDLDAALERAWTARPRTAAERRVQNRWLRQRRDACGTDIFCIEDAYDRRIGELVGYTEGPPPALRPWCRAARLNAAERAICADDTLADLDAAMEAVYGAARAASGDTEQAAWLRGERDACGPDRACIAAAYLRRITALGARLRGY